MVKSGFPEEESKNEMEDCSEGGCMAFTIAEQQGRF
jgi:hypothetical protein